MGIAEFHNVIKVGLGGSPAARSNAHRRRRPRFGDLQRLRHRRASWHRRSAEAQARSEVVGQVPWRFASPRAQL